MVTFSFQLAKTTEINKIKAILKALGVQKLKVSVPKNDNPSSAYTLEALKNKLEKSKASKSHQKLYR